MLVAVLLMVSVISTPAQQGVNMNGIFSDMRFVPQAGDVVGVEVFVMNGGDYAVVQIAEGAPDAPVVVEPVVRGAEISFSVPFGGEVLKFSGRITGNALVGTLGPSKVNLRRGRSYWQ